MKIDNKHDIDADFSAWMIYGVAFLITLSIGVAVGAISWILQWAVA